MHFQVIFPELMVARWACFLCLALFYALPGAAASAETASRAVTLLKEECMGCHNTEKKKGGLLLNSREALLLGGNEGVAAVPGKPQESRLLSMLEADADPHMPPKKQLTREQINLLREWIDEGLQWPAESEPATVELESLPPSYSPAGAIAISPDGREIVFARGGGIHLASVTNIVHRKGSNAVLRMFDAHRDMVQALAFNPNGNQFVSGAFRRLLLWNATNDIPQREITNKLQGLVTALKFAPSGDQLLVADSQPAVGGWVHLYSLTNDQHIVWQAHKDSIYGVDWTADGKRIATAGGDRLVRIWDAETQKEIATLEGHSAQVLGVAFNSNATQVVSGGADKELKVWDIATREKISSLGSHAAAITAVTWLAPINIIYAVTEGGGHYSYKNLKRHSGEQSSGFGEERKLAEVHETLLAVAATDGLTFAGSQEGTLFAWNKDGKQLLRLEAPTNMNRQAYGSATQADRAAPDQRGRFALSHALRSTKLSQIISLHVIPPALTLQVGETPRRLSVSAETPDGLFHDVSREARYARNGESFFEMSADLSILPKQPGEGRLTVHYRGTKVDVPVRVLAAGVTNKSDGPRLSFVRDILPVLGKAGCNAGACHAKPEGQNGFKLSVFSYDPKTDYHEIVREVRGRRVFPAAPGESLFLKKPTATLPHEGGRRFAPGSEMYNLLAQWIREGMPFATTNEPALEKIETYPKSRSYPKGISQQLLVEAHFSDGSVRDVTHLAAFESNDKEIAKVDENGLVTIGSLSGQGVVVARYMGFVADTHIIVPTERVYPAAYYTRLPRNNFIDDLAYAQFQRLGLLPSELSTDAEFLRRAKLDAIGVLPRAEEVRTFLADTNADKRSKLIAQILDDTAYADYWASKWADLLRPNPDHVGVKSVFILDQWLRASFRANKPYDQFVREILQAEGSNHRDGPAVVYRDRREPPELATMFGQLFLGTRLECAKCHHHPNEKWGQDDFYQFAAFFGSVKQKGAGLSPPISGGTEVFYFAPGGSVKHPVSGAVMQPKNLDGSGAKIPENLDPRGALVDWLIQPENPFFARAAVNRIWANFFGRGLVDPVDDFRISNPCVNQGLLDALARDFAAHKYDLKHLMRRIMESRLYQLSSTPNRSNISDTKNFSRAYRRRLPAEVLLDAVNDVTGVPTKFEAMPVATRAMQAWSYKIDSHFMDAFGRPNPSTDCPCERDTHMSVVQSLHMMNAKDLHAKLSSSKGRARQLANSGKTPAEIIEELYLSTLNRFPTAEESALASSVFSSKDATTQTATEDIFWALLNSAEFLFNH